MCFGGGQPAAPVHPAAYDINNSQSQVSQTVTPAPTNKPVTQLEDTTAGLPSASASGASNLRM